MSDQLRYLLEKNPNAYVWEVVSEVFEVITSLESSLAQAKAEIKNQENINSQLIEQCRAFHGQIADLNSHTTQAEEDIKFD